MLMLIKLLYVIAVAAAITAIDMFGGIDSQDSWMFIFQVMFWIASFRTIDKMHKDVKELSS